METVISKDDLLPLIREQVDFEKYIKSFFPFLERQAPEGDEGFFTFFLGEDAAEKIKEVAVSAFSRISDSQFNFKIEKSSDITYSKSDRDTEDDTDYDDYFKDEEDVFISPISLKIGADFIYAALFPIFDKMLFSSEETVSELGQLKKEMASEGGVFGTLLSGFGIFGSVIGALLGTTGKLVSNLAPTFFGIFTKGLAFLMPIVSSLFTKVIGPGIMTLVTKIIPSIGGTLLRILGPAFSGIFSKLGAFLFSPAGGLLAAVAFTATTTALAVQAGIEAFDALKEQSKSATRIAEMSLDTYDDAKNSLQGASTAANLGLNENELKALRTAITTLSPERAEEVGNELREKQFKLLEIEGQIKQNALKQTSYHTEEQRMTAYENIQRLKAEREILVQDVKGAIGGLVSEYRVSLSDGVSGFNEIAEKNEVVASLASEEFLSRIGETNESMMENLLKLESERNRQNIVPIPNKPESKPLEENRTLPSGSDSSNVFAEFSSASRGQDYDSSQVFPEIIRDERDVDVSLDTASIDSIMAENAAELRRNGLTNEEIAEYNRQMLLEQQRLNTLLSRKMEPQDSSGNSSNSAIIASGGGGTIYSGRGDLAGFREQSRSATRHHK